MKFPACISTVAELFCFVQNVTHKPPYLPLTTGNISDLSAQARMEYLSTLISPLETVYQSAVNSVHNGREAWALTTDF